METFTPLGAMSISTVPRAATALVVVFDPRGPRRAQIDYIRLNPKPVDGKHPTSTSVKATYSTQILRKPILNSDRRPAAWCGFSIWGDWCLTLLLIEMDNRCEVHDRTAAE